MTTAGWIALAITVLGAFGYAAASILQSIAARRSVSTVRTLGHPLYIVGTVCDLLAWAGSMIALQQLAVYLVESVLAGSLAVTAVAARVFLKSRLRNRDVAAVVVSVAALTVLAMSAGPHEHVEVTSTFHFWFCVTAPVMALLGWGAAKVCSPGVVAAVAGLCLGGAALAGRALPVPEQPMADLGGSALALVTEPMTAALVIFAAAGMLLYAHALQYGQVGPVTAVLWIAEVVAPSAVALAFLGDAVRPGWGLIATIAGVVTIGAAVLLATAPANGETAAPAPAALPAAPVPAALPAAPLVTDDHYAERIIWWGAPPVWRPPERTGPAPAPKPVASPVPVPQLTWSPPPHAEPAWPALHPSDNDTIEAPRPEIPVRLPRQPAPEPRRLQPWHDL